MMKRCVIIFLILMILNCMVMVTDAEEKLYDGIHVTLTREEIYEDRYKYILTVDNRRAGTIYGNMELKLPQDLSLKYYSWTIDGEKYPIEADDSNVYVNGTVFVKLPEALSHNKTSAVLEIEAGKHCPISIIGMYCLMYSEDYVNDYYVVADMVRNKLYGRYNINSVTFQIDQDENNEIILVINGDKSDSIGFKEGESVPWDYCAESVDIVRINDLSELGSHSLDSCTNLKEIYFYDENTLAAEDAFSNVNNNKITVYGYLGSSAEAYANKNNFRFVALNGSASGTYYRMNWTYDAKQNTMIITGAGRALYDPDWEYIADYVETVIISNDMTGIVEGTFYGFDSLKEMYIDDNVKQIDYLTDDNYYTPLLSSYSHDVAVIYCGAGTSAEKVAFLLEYNYVVDGVTRGDVNGDGLINAEDALGILKMSAKVMDALYYQADYNQDYLLNATDALMVLKNAARLAH